MVQSLRQQIVSQFKSLNLDNDKELKYTIAFAAKVCKTRIALITLADNNTKWLKLSKGLNIEQTAHVLSFCNAIKQKGVTVVNDTFLDNRFSDHPNVVSNLKIRFCACAPLVTREGHIIGTLCLLDYKPHEPDAEQKAMLKLLAKHAMSIMEQKVSFGKMEQIFNELNKEREERVTTQLKLRAMFEGLTDQYFLIGKKGELIDFNRAAYDAVLQNHNQKLFYGQPIKNVLTNAYKYGFRLHFKNALKGEREQFEIQADYGKKGKIWWECVMAPVSNTDNEIIGVSYVVRNIDTRKVFEEKIIEQNKLLSRIAEIQSHDYRGPVATILGLMNLIENDNYIASKEYLQMMQIAVNTLDEKIHEVVETAQTSKMSA
ncbi:GAF domain-containing protein [Mucilaginibacter sp. HMF5004]|uniref:GAF domain-containing protein n=1 Tax=Mucilaginibacter rivuli TaxID=2857527 RepID=UPI001C5D4C67|nr:GAF domain-containing protein [Mucilaginibacter rivuli]MBW4890799.1 GAF domain-containing protein [Mucilaginibacter rivuli]